MELINIIQIEIYSYLEYFKRHKNELCLFIRGKVQYCTLTFMTTYLVSENAVRAPA